MPQGSVKKNPRNTNPPPFQFNWGAPFGGFGPASWGQSFAPAYGYGAGGYVPFGGYGNTPRPTGYNPYAGYVTTPPAGGLGVGPVTPAAPIAPVNTWYGVAPGDPNVNEGRGVWRGYGDGGFGTDWDLMLNNPYGYGLTWDQIQEGYTPGASERNAYGQPLGTMAPYNNRRTARYSGPHNVARIQAGQGDAYWDANGRPLKKNPLKKLKKQGAGASPAWVNGLAQLNIP